MIKTQIEELRRILFAKLEAANKMHLINIQRIRSAKQAKRKFANQMKIEVLKKVNKRTPAITNVNETRRLASSIEREVEINSTLQEIQERKSKIQEHIDKLSKLEDISHEMEKQIKEEIDLDDNELPSTECEEGINESVALADFDSFTQVVSKKLNLKPEEASPSSILSRFRNNLNKKIQEEANRNYIENGTNDSVIDDFKEEDYIVEEVFFEDINPEDIDEYDSSYILPDNPELSTYNINDITLTKVPSASPTSRPLDNSYILRRIQCSEPTNVLHSLDIEKVLLKDRPKALLQLQEIDREPDPQEKAKEKREALQDLLQQKLDQLEADATLARKCLLTLDRKKNKCLFTLDRMKTQATKGRPKKHMLENPIHSGLKVRLPIASGSRSLFPLEEIESARERFTDNFTPYVVQKSNENRMHRVVVEANNSKEPMEKYHPKVSKNTLNIKPPKPNNDLDEKLKALFKNNNLKGNLMKRKSVNTDAELVPYKERKLEEIVNGEEVNCNEEEIDNHIEITTIPSPVFENKPEEALQCDTVRKVDSINPHPSTKNNHNVNNKARTIVHDVTLARTVKKEMKKPKLVFPGDSSKLVFLKKPLVKQRIERDNLKTLKTNSKRTVEEFDKSDSKSKKLLERLKQQIFDKLHQQEKGRRVVDVRLELETRLKKRDKMRN